MLQRSSVAAAGVAVLLLLLSACGTEATPTPPPPLLITGLFNLTGAMAAYDVPVSQGTQVAVDERNATGGIKGRRIQYTMQNTATDPAQIAAAAAAAIKGKAIALLGFSDPDSVLSAAPLAQQAGIPFMTVLATSPRLPRQIGDMFFMACWADNEQAAVGAEYLYDKLGARRVALLTDNSTDYTRGLAQYFKVRWNELAPNGILLDQTFQPGDDYSPLVAQVKALNPAPDALYIAAISVQLTDLLPALRAAGLNQPIMGGDGYDDPSLYAGKTLSNIYYTTHGALPAPASGPLHDFVAAYTKKYGKPPETILPALGYDGARLLFDAIERAADTSGPAIRAALEATKNFPGATGAISFGPPPTGHIPDKPVTVMVVQNGQVQAGGDIRAKSVPPP